MVVLFGMRNCGCVNLQLLLSLYSSGGVTVKSSIISVTAQTINHSITLLTGCKLGCDTVHKTELYKKIFS